LINDYNHTMSLDSDSSKKISLYQFEPLNEGNYQEWQTRMIWKLEELELEKHIDPLASMPAQDEKEKWAAWSKDHRRAMRSEQLVAICQASMLAKSPNAGHHWRFGNSCSPSIVFKAQWVTFTSGHH
jgi:hypothetical protein